ncbi:MAG: nucleotide exchange factor GrpE [Desulfobacca sp. 4484_104]|nr:MAG: nucleotide exchange factor GrpE [Desulfobacca sp. 4484_104]RLA88293.1 MAG: nucleotide exchange factor GrpE [Deltaproteobacteria bacterium]
MNLRIFNFFKKKPAAGKPPEPAIQVLEEIQDLKKYLRKQNFLLESFKNDVFKAMVDHQRPRLEPYCALADALFYYDAALQAGDHSSPEQRETLEIIWDKLEGLLSIIGLQIMRRAGADFDPQLYEAVENRSDGATELMVLQVLQPGYIFNNMVLKPAKVVVGSKNEHLEG